MTSKKKYESKISGPEGNAKQSTSFVNQQKADGFNTSWLSTTTRYRREIDRKSWKKRSYSQNKDWKYCEKPPYDFCRLADKNQKGHLKLMFEAWTRQSVSGKCWDGNGSNFLSKFVRGVLALIGRVFHCTRQLIVECQLNLEAFAWQKQS